MVEALAGARRAVAMHQAHGRGVDDWLAGEVRFRGIRENAAVLAVLELLPGRREETARACRLGHPDRAGALSDLLAVLDPPGPAAGLPALRSQGQGEEPVEALAGTGCSQADRFWSSGLCRCSSGRRLSPVPARRPSMRPGWYWIFFRPRRMTWPRWAKLATARLVSTPPLSTDQMPSTGLRTLCLSAPSQLRLTSARPEHQFRNEREPPGYSAPSAAMRLGNATSLFSMTSPPGRHGCGQTGWPGSALSSPCLKAGRFSCSRISWRRSWTRACALQVSGRSTGCLSKSLNARESTSPGQTLPHGARG
jgi:hypothetical protein